MACDTVRRPEQTLAERIAEVDRALKRLAQQIASGRVQVNIGPTGAVAFAGWNDRDGLTDACAYRSLAIQGNWELRQAVARAEAMTGRKVNPNAVAEGHHSHDGGNTWHKGH
jgi:hypothetical protein